MSEFTVFGTEEWFDYESLKSQLQDQLWELKFNDGRRIYYSILPEKNVILLLGGNKNGQQKDIAKAKKILTRK